MVLGASCYFVVVWREKGKGTLNRKNTTNALHTPPPHSPTRENKGLFGPKRPAAEGTRIDLLTLVGNHRIDVVDFLRGPKNS